MSRVLITGASGFLGGVIAEYFVSKGHDTFGWDIVPNQRCSYSDNIDLHNLDQIEKKLLDVRPDIIVHCAGMADVSRSVTSPLLDFDSNVIITYNLLATISKLELKDVRVVFLSSAAVYGNPQILPISENANLSPISPYALHKIMCENICRYFIFNNHIDIKIARIFSAYGPGLRKQIFWDMCQKWKNDRRLQMFGTGDESRDFIYSEDVAQAIFLIATKETYDVVFNVANGEEISIREVTKWFANSAEIDDEMISFNGIQRMGNPLNWRADIGRLCGLGYIKTVNIEDGILNYWRWVESLNEY